MGYLPDFHESSIPAVRLLQGALYSDDERSWNLLLSNRSRLEQYFGRVGLLLVVDEAEGFAYLRQLDDDELPGDYESLPKLIRKSRLGYDLTLFCVLLRDELRRFDEQNLEFSRCVVNPKDLMARFSEYVTTTEDQVRLKKKFDQLVTRAVELGFLRKLPTQPVSYEIRPIIKARLPVERLEELKQQMADYANSQAATHNSDEEDSQDG